jgi:Flp pilus assembly protein TadD
MKGVLVLLLGFASAAACAQTPTWREQIAPIVYKNCTTCHHEGGSGPFPLMTYEQVKRRADLVETATKTRYMPPWLPDSGAEVVRLAGDRHLSAGDLSLIAAWVKAGAPEGKGAAPAPPAYTSEWQLGPPDMIVEMPLAMQVAASGTDLFENFALPVPLAGTRWVRAMEIKPGSPQVVHHANVTVDRTASVRRGHPADWQQGIPGMDLLVDSGDRFDPDSHFLFWKPDSTALVEPAGMPWRLDPGNDLVLNMHLKPTGKAETVRARIGLYFTPQPATLQPMLLQLEHDAALDIPAGDANFVVEDHLKLPVAVDVLGVYPHAHYLGKRMEAWATTPAGQRHTLILIKDWDIDRQSVYRLAHPLTLPAGSVVHMRYTYDNSAANVRNPHTPPMRVRAGNRSEDEMAHFWLQVLPRAAAGREDPRFELERAWMENRLSKDARDPLAQFNLAAMLIEEGHPDKAAALYRQVAAENPTDTRALTALGSALALSGESAAAEQQFRAALARDPAAQAPAFDLASLLLKREDYAEAERLLIGLTQAHPDDAGAQRLLALTYAGLGDPGKALAPLEAWARLTPKDPDPHRALAQVYDALGRSADALAQQRLVLDVSPNAPADWNDLGVMEARAGDKPSARRAFEHALSLDPNNEAARNNLGRAQ